MALGYGASAILVTLGTIMFVMGTEFTVIGFMYPDAIKLPISVSLPMLGVGLAAAVSGYLLWYMKAQSRNELCNDTSNAPSTSVPIGRPVGSSRKKKRVLRRLSEASALI